MTSLARRRLYNTAALFAASLAVLIVHTSYSLSLRSTSFATGWLLVVLLFALTLYNARKKLPFLPLLPSSAWLQAHVYVGLFTLVVFAMHVGFRIPNGWLEGTLALLFFGVVASGFIGLALSRLIPGRLRTRGELVIFERQPIFRRRLGEQLDALVDEIDSMALSDFHVRRLMTFFARPRHFWWHLMQSPRPRETLLTELDYLDGYLRDDERAVKERIGELIRTKADLEYHCAHQAVLKYWLFVHIPLSYSLLIVGLAHAVVVYTFLR